MNSILYFYSRIRYTYKLWNYESFEYFFEYFFITRIYSLKKCEYFFEYHPNFIYKNSLQSFNLNAQQNIVGIEKKNHIKEASQYYTYYIYFTYTQKCTHYIFIVSCTRTWISDLKRQCRCVYSPVNRTIFFFFTSHFF